MRDIFEVTFAKLTLGIKTEYCSPPFSVSSVAKLSNVDSAFNVRFLLCKREVHASVSHTWEVKIGFVINVIIGVFLLLPECAVKV